MARLLGKHAKIPNRSLVRCEDAQALSDLHAIQRALGLQQWHGARQADGINGDQVRFRHGSLRAALRRDSMREGVALRTLYTVKP
jgi:hypothetical protein